MEERFAPLRPAARYGLTDPGEGEFFREQFPYSSVPRVLFDQSDVSPRLPERIWITDTSFRDGQQARPPFTAEQVARLFALLSRLGGPAGLVRQSEFFLYSRRDAAAIEACQSLGLPYPEITGWIRASAEDLPLVRRFGLAETGILTPVSDYHIYLRMRSTREKALEEYLGIVREALSMGIRPRCHFEDVTRADIRGFCLPFAKRLMDLMGESGVPIKIRLCDTMGFGVTYPRAILPRSVPKLVSAFSGELGYPPELLEWHGHNDFHKAHANATTAWLYGCSALNASLLGFGERTGNPPLEAACVEYAALTGGSGGMDLRAITDIAAYYRDAIGASIPANQPFVGAEFNVTRAGAHAEGMQRNPEVYAAFDTMEVLGRPMSVMVTDKSGMAGVAEWLNENLPRLLGRPLEEPVSKRHPGVKRIADWVAAQYEQGRTTSISPEELVAQAKHYLPSLFVSDFHLVQDAARAKAAGLAARISSSGEVRGMDPSQMDDFLHEVVSREGSIQLLAVTNLEGRRISQAWTQRGEKGLFRNLMNKDFRKHEWFVAVLETGQPFYSDLFFSKYTGRLVMTVAMPLLDAEGAMYAVMDIDFRFDELVKLITPIPDEILGG
jgi:citrate (Re)-synthase